MAKRSAETKQAAAKPAEAGAVKPPRTKAAVARSTASKLTTSKSVAFDVEARDLPKAIEKAAFGSGDYPHDKKMKRKRYEREMAPLQIELQKLLGWARTKGERIVVVFEGRDGAGKGGAIARFTEHLNPRQARVVALTKPTDIEKSQWYFQRYASHMPSAGEVILFDRSWYNRAGVERVMGFASPEQAEAFLHEAPAFEGMLVRDGVRLIKLFLTIGREMQMQRLHARWNDPLKRWKLSPIDFEAIPRFDAYSQAFDALLAQTSTEAAPWTVVRANDKRRTRLNTIRHVLRALPYDGKDDAAIGEIDDQIVLSANSYLAKGGEI